MADRKDRSEAIAVALLTSVIFLVVMLATGWTSLWAILAVSSASTGVSTIAVLSWQRCWAIRHAAHVP